MKRQHAFPLLVSFDLAAFAARIRSARQQLRMSVREVARLSGVSPSHVRRMEGGQFDFTIGKLVKVAAVVGVPPATCVDVGLSVAAEYDREGVVEEIELHSVFNPDLGAEAFTARLENAQIFLDGLLHLTLKLMLSGNPRLVLRKASFPIAGLDQLFSRFTESLEVDYSEAEKFALIEALQRRPYHKLKSLGLVSPALVEAYLEARSKQLTTRKGSRTSRKASS